MTAPNVAHRDAGSASHPLHQGRLKGLPFVKTLKRDYVHAIAVLELLAGWLEDYTIIHLHSGLKMRSPREFIAAQTATA